MQKLISLSAHVWNNTVMLNKIKNQKGFTMQDTIITTFINGCSGAAFKQSIKSTDDVHRIGFIVNSKEAADSIASLFPKYCKVNSSSIGSNDETGKYSTRPYVTLNLRTNVNKATGELNETGIKRKAKILEVLAANGLEIKGVK